MVATNQTRPYPIVPRTGRWSAQPYAVDRMLADAAALELRAPELALVLGERASALAEAAGAAELWVRAESLVVSARVRMGLRAATVARAVAALRAAEDLGDDVLAAGLRTDLAICARSVGAPLAGLAALRRVLDVPGLSGAARATVLCHLVGCLYQFGQKPDLDRMLAEADRLCGADEGLDDDGKLVARALVRVGVSAHRRRHGDVMGAADAARTGLGFLQQLEDPQADGGVARVRLVLQLVCSLLDRGDTSNALEIAQPVMDEPVRAASVGPTGWLRLAVATRILLPSGAIEAAAGVLREGVHIAERHELHALTAPLWAELAHVENRLGCPSEAIECLHRGRAEEHLYARVRRQAMSLLSGELGNGGHAEVDLDEVLGSVPSLAPALPVAAVPVTSVPGVSRLAPSEPATGRREAESPALRWPAEQPVAAAASQRVAAEPAADQRAAERPPAETRSAEELRAGERPAEKRPVEMRAAEEKAIAGRSSIRQPAEWRAPTASAGERPAQPSPQRPAARQEPEEQLSKAGLPMRKPRVAPVVALRPEADGDQAKTATPLKPVTRPPSQDAAPASLGKPRLPLGFEALIRLPGKETDEAAETRGHRRAREESAAKATTRHDSEHGSVAARSVLDRLGISAGTAGGGGRRRAEPGQEGSPTSDAATESDDARAESSAKDSPVASGAIAKDETVVDPPAAERETPASVTPQPAAREPESPAARPPATDNWLPRLKLPPSLAPFDELPLDDKLAGEKPVADKPASTSETHFTNAPVIEGGDLGNPFAAEHSSMSLDDDLPADAGLADLLARALAEHQAGTASAAALVKRLGNQNPGEARTVNGHGRNNGDIPPNGRHRNGS